MNTYNDKAYVDLRANPSKDRKLEYSKVGVSNCPFGDWLPM